MLFYPKSYCMNKLRAKPHNDIVKKANSHEYLKVSMQLGGILHWMCQLFMINWGREGKGIYKSDIKKFPNFIVSDRFFWLKIKSQRKLL